MVQRHEGKKPDDKRLGIGSRRRTAPSDWGGFSIIQQELLYKELALTDDFVHHGDSIGPVSRYGGNISPPDVSQRLLPLSGQTPDDRKAEHKITTSATSGKRQLEGDASCVITGAIIDKLK